MERIQASGWALNRLHSMAIRSRRLGVKRIHATDWTLDHSMAIRSRRGSMCLRACRAGSRPIG
ncbi:MAG: hypothetical protein ACREDZ_13400 [Kiloniellales bacterium]